MSDEHYHFFRRKSDYMPRQRQDESNFTNVESQVHRFVSRDGRVNILKQGILRGQPVDWYHLLLTIRWPWLLLIAGSAYIVIIALFAALYMLDAQGISGMRSHGFFHFFFFSSHIFSTIGFSQYFPTIYYTETLITIESFVGWCSFGLITGLLFSRFSRPTARVIFSHFAVIEQHDGKPTLVFRAANRRGNLILHGQVHVTLTRNEKTLEGESVRRIYELPLLRARSSFFNLTWTVRHLIDEASPLYGQTEESLRKNETELAVLLSGTDDTFGQTVHGHFAYNHEEILFDHRFVSMFRRNDEGHPVIDFSKFDMVEEVAIKASPA